MPRKPAEKDKNAGATQAKETEKQKKAPQKQRNASGEVGQQEDPSSRNNENRRNSSQENNASGYKMPSESIMQQAAQLATQDVIRQKEQAQQDQAVKDSHTGTPGSMDSAGYMPSTVEGQLDTTAPVITREKILKATETMQKYRAGKANLEERLIANEDWWKLRQWRHIDHGATDDPKPSSAWLFNCILNKHAEYTASYPEPNVLPREPGDKEEAKRLSSILPVILDQNEYEQTYSDVGWAKIKSGTGVSGVFWDGSKLGGMGDISIKKIDLINLFWQPGITDIQDSANVFHVELIDNEVLEDLYPDKLHGKLGSSIEQTATSRYVYDDTVDTSEKSAVVDWYYKKRTGQGSKTVLHYVKYVNDVVLYASEDDPNTRERGWYDHGLYPFVFDTLFPADSGTPCGYGYIDIGKDAQERIDVLNNVITQNSLVNARPRFFVASNCTFDEDEFMDTTKQLVHVSGNIQDAILPVQTSTITDAYVASLNMAINELKETTGNRDVTNGGGESGVQAASALAIIQEAAGKIGKSTNKASYRAYKKIVLLVIELIRQFYDLPRQFRILGQYGQEEFVSYSNEGIKPIQSQYGPGMDDISVRTPLFDIDVRPQAQTAYTKQSNNELMLNFYQLGLLNPENSDMALALIESMEFDGKNELLQKIQRNGTMYQQIKMLQMQVLQMATIIDKLEGTDLSQKAGSAFMGVPISGDVPSSASGVELPEKADVEDDGTKQEEHPYVQKGRQAANSFVPNGG